MTRDLPRAVPQARLARLAALGQAAGGVAVGALGEGLRRIARGERPALSEMLLTPANAHRVAGQLSRMRGAAMKLGQMLSMDAGGVLPPEVAAILARLREDAHIMPARQLQDSLAVAWGSGWQDRFATFDLRPFAAASIGQVHRAAARDGRALAIKVQYPGVRDSIDSDIDNVAGLLRLPGLVPAGVDLAPLLAEARRQLHLEADYAAEARHLAAFCGLLSGSPAFRLPELCPEFCTPQVLAMTYVESQPIESLARAPQAERDRVMADLVTLTLREIFEFGLMQTDPNLANYRLEPGTGRVVLLDFGAVAAIAPGQAQDFRALLNAALDRDPAAVRAAMLRIGYFDATTAPQHQALILKMFDLAMAPIRSPDPFDFAGSDLVVRLRDMGLALGRARDLQHVPPADTLFLHRKIVGIYLMAARIGARVALRPIVERFR